MFDARLDCDNGTEHRGHDDLFELFQEKLSGSEEWTRIYNLLEVSGVVEKPLPFIILKGQITKKEFLVIEREMWRSFNGKDYIKVERLIDVVMNCRSSDGTRVYNIDCEVAALCFRAVILVHRDGKHDDAIHVLINAQLKAKESEENRTILMGRIYQRMSQINLTMKHREKVDVKQLATNCFEKAKHELQFVGKGFDKAKILCREAKILSTKHLNADITTRAKIEEMYDTALSCLEEDEAYFFACYSSALLSKAAFHLYFSFSGFEECSRNCTPQVSEEDVEKAEETLNRLSPYANRLTGMRRHELDILQAELCRLKGISKFKEAYKMLSRITTARTADAAPKNILVFASHRLNCVKNSLISLSANFNMRDDHLETDLDL